MKVLAGACACYAAGHPFHVPTRSSAASSRSPTRKKTLTYPACKGHVNEPATNPAVNEGRRKPRRIAGVPVLLALLP